MNGFLLFGSMVLISYVGAFAIMSDEYKNFREFLGSITPGAFFFGLLMIFMGLVQLVIDIL